MGAKLSFGRFFGQKRLKNSGSNTFAACKTPALGKRVFAGILDGAAVFHEMGEASMQPPWFSEVLRFVHRPPQGKILCPVSAIAEPSWNSLQPFVPHATSSIRSVGVLKFAQS
jgi:hypothetical protein